VAESWIREASIDAGLLSLGEGSSFAMRVKVSPR